MNKQLTITQAQLDSIMEKYFQLGAGYSVVVTETSSKEWIDVPADWKSFKPPIVIDAVISVQSRDGKVKKMHGSERSVNWVQSGAATDLVKFKQLNKI